MSIEDVVKRWKDIANTSAERTRPYIYYPSSFPSLHNAIGSKEGFRGGTVLQLLAQNKTGKTTLAADIVANAQRLGYPCAWLDYECALDQAYTAKLGVDIPNLIYATPTYIDRGTQLTEELIEAGVKVLVVDSAPEAQHPSEKESKMTDNQRAMGTSGDWTRHLKRMKPINYNNDALYIVINQYRANTKQMGPHSKQWVPWGCQELYYSSGYLLEMTRIKNEEGKATVQVVVAKSKASGSEGNKTELILEHGEGFRKDLDTVDYAIKVGVVNQKGAWLNYNEFKAQGKENACREFPLEEIRKELERL